MLKRAHIFIAPILLAVWSTVASPCLGAEPGQIRIGVLSFRSLEQTKEQWQPTADYLSDTISGYRFEMAPMKYRALEEAIASRQLDFVLTNTGHYVSLEAQYGIARILTMVVSVDGQPFKEFGGVIFTRADRTDINSLADLRHKRFLAVGADSLGGYLVAWQTLLHNGINPQKDFAELLFNGLPQDNIVFRVQSGEVDAGTVRTHVLENMAREGKIPLEQFKVLNPRRTPGFPYLLSTQLYPEWPLARLPHTDDAVVEQVIVALLTMKRGTAAAVAGNYDRWIPPLNYQGVHELFKELRIGPYKDFGAFTLRDVFVKYLTEIVFFLVFLALILLFMAKIVRLNESLRKALSEVRTLRGFLPICSSCKKIRDDSGYWNRIETYIRQHSDAEFSHSICPDCAAKLYTDYHASLADQANRSPQPEEEPTTVQPVRPGH